MSSHDNYILGISAYYHDSAAAILKNGQIVAATQQERYSRKKHDPAFPVEAIEFCLSEAAISIEQLQAVVFYDKPLLKFERLLETYLANAPKGYRSFVKAMPIWLKEKLYLKKVLKDEIKQLRYREYALQSDISVEESKQALSKSLKLPQLFFCEHHQSHAAAAYYPSPFTDATVVCLDGVGEWATSSIWKGHSGSLEPLLEIQFPHSLGLLYSAFTQYCGFKVNSGEYKLMGLAPYGKPVYEALILEHLVKVREDGSFTLDMRYFDFATGNTMTNKRFHDLFSGPPHPFDSTMTQKQMDLARSIQAVTEMIVLKIIAQAKRIGASDNLCLAGGVALNCVANARILNESDFKNIWIQPAAGDAGSALGAALQIWHGYFENEKQTSSNDLMRGAYLGDNFDSEEIKATCSGKKVVFHELNAEKVPSITAELITQQKVVGWFQDKMEFGPRALGNRSIIGDARSIDMQYQMNMKIKQRESFRPFAPAVLEEYAHEWFDCSVPSPYMLLTSSLNKSHQIDVGAAEGLEQLKQVRSDVPAITHVDYSARLQTVSSETNPKFHSLITEVYKLTNVPMVINTSFNVRGEPPVRSPEDAIRTFLATEMDVLVMQNIILYKEEQSLDAIENAKAVSFEKD